MQENNIIDIRNEDGKLVGRFCFETATLTIKLKDCVTDIRYQYGGEREVINSPTASPLTHHNPTNYIHDPRDRQTAVRNIWSSQMFPCRLVVSYGLMDMYGSSRIPAKGAAHGIQLWKRKIPYREGVRPLRQDLPGGWDAGGGHR